MQKILIKFVCSAQKLLKLQYFLLKAVEIGHASKKEGEKVEKL